MVDTSPKPEPLNPEEKDAAQNKINDAFDAANKIRAQGNEHFKAGNTIEALRAYYTVLLSLKGLDQSISSAFQGTPAAAADSTASPMLQKVKLTIGLVYTNMAACHARNEKWQRCLECAKDNGTRQALALDENNKKAAFREAQARIGLGEITAGKKLLVDLNKRSPDSAVVALLSQLELKEKERAKKSAASLSGFLSTKPSTG